MKIDKFDLEKEIFIIAELSANHCGSLDLAKESIKAAKRAGADAIKLQTYKASSLTLSSKKEDFFIKEGPWANQSLYELYEKAKTPYSWHKTFFETAHNEGLICFSSPFDKEGVDFLEAFNPPAYKIASFEITDYDLIKYVALKQKPILISTGIATYEEIKDVVNICKSVGNDQIILLKCTSSYPAPPSEANLLTIPKIKEDFNVEVGFSDHTLGATAGIIAVSLGARVIEKHFILNKDIKSEDSSFSLDENEFSQMVRQIRQTQLLLGHASFNLSQKSLKNRQYARSLYVCKEIKKGELITKENIKSVRPFFGLHPKYLLEVLGKKANKDLSFAQRLSLKDIN